tara:strand:- start:266 stop:1837 length:1572 start_codon:yes stop_codon:yes gene_type:complete
MSTHKSYFSKNNTLISNREVNTSKNPVTEIFYGGGSSRYVCIETNDPLQGCIDDDGVYMTGYTRQRINNSFSRFIFDLDLNDLITKYKDNTINLSGGCLNSATTHTLRMVNTSTFDEGLLNTTTSKGNRRATSFDLVLIKLSGSTSATTWAEGVGYDYTDTGSDWPGLEDKSYSTRPSNWYYESTLNKWCTDGAYDWYSFSSCTPTIIDVQSFDNGNENVAFDMTSEVNTILTGGTGYTSAGYAIAYVKELEALTGLTESYSTGFFTKYTQTFYEPFLETNYDDYIDDARNFFYEGKTNCLYLYVNAGGVPTSLDILPTVTIYNSSGDLLSTLQASQVTKGVYCVCFSIPCDTYSTPCIFTDRWSGLVIDGNCQSNVTNKFTLKDNSQYFEIGTHVGLPKHYGFSVYGIKRDEKIVNGDIRKVIVSARKEYSTEVPQPISNISYRMYVKQGTTEVETHPWTNISRANNQNYFLVDTGDMIPNEYYLDIKAVSDLEVNTYHQNLKFQVVNQANYFGNPPADYRQ